MLLSCVFFAFSDAPANTLRVDRSTGRVTWENTDFVVVGSFGYEINSASGSLNPNHWLSIAEHGDADSGGSVGPGGTWDIWAARPVRTAEASVDGSFFLQHGELLDLGTGLCRTAGEEDLEFSYFDQFTFELTPAPVEYFGTAPLFPARDYNANGLVEQEDLDLVLSHWGSDAATPPAAWANDRPAGSIDQDELDNVLANWGNASGNTSTAAAVPESATALLLLIAAAVALALRSQKRSA